MIRSRSLILFALAMLLGLSSCGSPSSGTAGDPAQQTAQQQFLAERGGTPGTDAGGADAESAVFGRIEQVDGSTVVVKDPISGQSTTIQLAADGVVRKQVTIDLSDIQAGDPITAFGTHKGSLFEAMLIRIGEGGALPGGSGPFMFGRDPGAGPPPGAAPPPGDAGGDFVSGIPQGERLAGTVEEVEGNTIKMKSADGASVDVQLAANASVSEQVDVAPTELKPGTFIAASGSRNGDVFQATRVDILPSPPGS